MRWKKTENLDESAVVSTGVARRPVIWRGLAPAGRHRPQLNSVSRRIFRARKSRRCGGNWNRPAVLVGSPTSGRQVTCEVDFLPFVIIIIILLYCPIL
jgi:hypothetical protein